MAEVDSAAKRGIIVIGAEWQPVEHNLAGSDERRNVQQLSIYDGGFRANCSPASGRREPHLGFWRKCSATERSEAGDALHFMVFLSSYTFIFLFLSLSR